ncbi:MAG TPA: hypothetical protein VMT60_01955 [Candidatus Bathyarchaeia archaeon]|nr:hypothetical protein [Candidatus Bathyarchaeia archaeon]
MKVRLRAALVPVALFIAVALSAPASAQSVFGIDFLGEDQFVGSGRYRALGLSAYAALDTMNAVSANPATMADLSSLTVSVLEMVGLSTVRRADVTAYENRFQMPSVMIGVPLRKGLVFGVGYHMRFEGKNSLSYANPIAGAPTGFDVYTHRSGLFTVPFSLAWRPLSWARVSGSYQLESGPIRDDFRVVYYPEYYGTVDSKRLRRFSGSSWNVSALVQVQPRLLLAAGMNTKVAYGVDETFTYTLASLDSISHFDFTLPLSWEVGASAGIIDRWWLHAHLWQRGAPEPHGFPQLAGSIGDERLVSFGVERLRAQSGAFFSRIPLRLGFYENRWHLEYPAGRSVTSRFVTFGTGFSLPGGPGALDVSFEAGQTGSIGNNGVDERVFRIAVGLSASEAWSKRKTER